MSLLAPPLSIAFTAVFCDGTLSIYLALHLPSYLRLWHLILAFPPVTGPLPVAFYLTSG
jgi:hypothetical protein